MTVEMFPTCEMWYGIHFLNVLNIKFAEIHCKICEVYDGCTFYEEYENVNNDEWRG